LSRESLDNGPKAREDAPDLRRGEAISREDERDRDRESRPQMRGRPTNLLERPAELVARRVPEAEDQRIELTIAETKSCAERDRSIPAWGVGVRGELFDVRRHQTLRTGRATGGASSHLKAAEQAARRPTVAPIAPSTTTTPTPRMRCSTAPNEEGDSAPLDEWVVVTVGAGPCKPSAGRRSS
jgi:hypothetical protein